jgi:diguanylate cyclase (GGDEF)-like protein/PAS domain S-box-containing protein
LTAPAPPPEPLRLVLVEPSDGLAALVAALLAHEPRTGELRRFAKLDDALVHLAHIGAECVLLGLDAADDAGLATLHQVLDAAPGVPVVALVDPAGAADGVRLIRAGAQDVILRGRDDGRALVRSIRHAVERRRTGEREEVARLVREVAADFGDLASHAAGAPGRRRHFTLAIAAVVAILAVQLCAGIRLGGGTQLLYALPVAFAAATTTLRRGLVVGGLAVLAAGLWGLLYLPEQLHVLAAAVRALALAAIAAGAHRIQAQATDRAALLRAVMDSTTDCVSVRDVEGRHVLVNQGLADLLGRSPEQLLGRPLHEVVDAATADAWTHGDDAVLAAGGTQRAWRTITVDGVERTFSTVKSPLRDAHGRVMGTVGIARDETDVRRLEAEASRFFELAPDMLCTARPDGRLERLNGAWAGTLGWSAPELRSRPIVDFVHPRDRDRAREEIDALLRGEADGCTNRLATKAGGWRDIEWTARLGPDGQLYAAARDVTERNAMARELRAGEARYRALAESLPGSAVLTFDHDLRFTFAAGEPLAALGLDGGLVGRTLAEAVHGRAARLTPRFRAALGGVDQSFEHTTPDGRAHWIQLTSVRDGDGAVSGGMAVVQDIDGLRRAEREVVRAEERFRAAFEQAPIGMALVDLDGRLQRVNDALSGVTGVPPGELIGVPFATLAHPDDRDLVVAGERALVEGRVAVHAAEHRWLRRDGAERWVAVRAILVRDDGGAPMHVLAQVQDVTEPRRLEARLRHQADHDPLTGLLNRRRFETELALQADTGAAGALLLVDLDDFKEVNERHGHAAGDDLLVRVAGVLRATLGPGALVARLGGDEFAALLGEGDTRDGEAAAGRVVEAVRATAGANVTASVGVAGFGAAGQPGEAVLARADLALYAVKAAGRDGWGTVEAPPVMSPAA